MHLRWDNLSLYIDDEILILEYEFFSHYVD